MSAAEQQRVDLGVAHRREQPLGEHGHLVARRLAALDELDEPRTRRARQLDRRVGRGDRSLVGARSDRADGADHADAPVAGRADQRAHAGLDHADHRHRQLRGQVVERRRRRGVARDDDGLHVELLDEGGADLEGELLHLGLRPWPVRVAAGVADVHEVLVGQQVDDGPGDGEAAEAAVEHPDRAVVGHHERLRAKRADPERSRS